MTTRCPHCLGPNETPSRLLRWAAVAAAWTVIVLMLVGLSLASLFAVPLVPLIVFAGSALIGASHQYAFGERICADCGRAYDFGTEKRVGPAAVEAEPAQVFAAS